MKPCANKQKLIAWLALDALDAAVARELRTHLETCAGCRGYLADLARVQQQLAAAVPDSDLRPSASFHQTVLARLAAAAPSAWSVRGMLADCAARLRPGTAALRAQRNSAPVPGRDGALRRPRPRPSGRNESGESCDYSDSVPSPDAALGDGDSAARCPYPGTGKPMPGFHWLAALSVAAVTVLFLTVCFFQWSHTAVRVSPPTPAIVPMAVAADPEADLTPSLANYQWAASQSPDNLDGLLARQGKAGGSSAPVYTAAARSMDF